MWVSLYVTYEIKIYTREARKSNRTRLHRQHRFRLTQLLPLRRVKNFHILASCRRKPAFTFGRLKEIFDFATIYSYEKNTTQARTYSEFLRSKLDLP